MCGWSAFGPMAVWKTAIIEDFPYHMRVVEKLEPLVIAAVAKQAPAHVDALLSVQWYGDRTVGLRFKYHADAGAIDPDRAWEDMLDAMTRGGADPASPFYELLENHSPTLMDFNILAGDVPALSMTPHREEDKPLAEFVFYVLRIVAPPPKKKRGVRCGRKRPRLPLAEPMLSDEKTV